MNILIVRPTATVINRNSYNIQEEGIAKEYAKNGHNCTIVFYTDKDYEEENILVADKCFRVVWMPAVKVYDNAIFYRKYMKRLIDNSDVIVTEEYEQMYSCYLAYKYYWKTIIYHGPYDCAYKSRYQKKSQLFDKVFLRKLQSVNTQFVTKSNLSRRTIEAKGFKDITVIPVGIDLTKFSASEYNNCILSYESKNPIRLLYIGVLEDRRNITFMIEVMKVLKTFMIPFEFTIVGDGEKSYVNECISLVHKYGLSKDITFGESKPQSELPAIYKSHDIFLLPSKYEIFGMVILEAMLFGRIVLSSNNGGSDAVINDGKNGFILGIESPMAWAKKIKDIYDGKYSAEKISHNAHEIVLNRCTWENAAHQFENVIRRKINGKSQSSNC